MQFSHIVKSLLVGIALGVLFASFYAVSQPEPLRILAAGALTGMCISIAIGVLERLFDVHIERLPSRLRIPAKSLEYLVGGLSGWICGMLLASKLFGFGISVTTLLRGNWTYPMAVTGTVAVVVGLSFYAYRALERRLERTIEQLKQREWAEKELQLAREIQTRLLPPQSIEGDGFRVDARNLAAQFVAGDFYDVVRLDDGSIVIVVADVAGKGLGASLIMASVKAVLPFVAREGARRAMEMLNAKLVKELGPREFVALACARLQPHDGTLELVNAGLPEPYVVSANGVRALTTRGERLPLGLRASAAYEPLAARLEEHEHLIFLTDGIPEAPAGGEPLGYDRVASILGACGVSLTLDDFLSRVRAVVDEGLADDWTAVVVRRA